MENFRYKSVEEVTTMYNNSGNVRKSDLFDCGISVSYRVYDKYGNTLEFHVYYVYQ